MTDSNKVKLTKEEKIRKILDEQLNKENQELYADLLNNRIEENRKTMTRLSATLILCCFTFPLITESKIAEISFGAFKLTDNIIAMGIIPSIFAFIFYKYITVWIDLVEQKMTYNTLTSKIFSIDQKYFLNQRLRPYSFLDSIMLYHLDEKSKTLGCIISLFWVPIGLTLIIFPFVFEYYMITTLYDNFGFDSLLKKIIIITPILIGIFTILIIIQAGKRDFDEKKYSSQQRTELKNKYL